MQIQRNIASLCTEAGNEEKIKYPGEKSKLFRKEQKNKMTVIETSPPPNGNRHIIFWVLYKLQKCT